MSEQWIRHCRLVVANADGDGLDLSELKIKFTITRADVRTPCAAIIRIYNLSSDTRSRIQHQFTQVFLTAGYNDNFGLIFSGGIKNFVRGRENATDTYLDIQAADGDDPHNWATVSTTLAAGNTKADQYKALLKGVEQFGVTYGYKPEFDDVQLPRGKVLWGMHRDRMDDLAGQCKATWQYSNGKLNMVPDNSYIPTDAVVLTSKTGMIGLPQQNLNGGITVRCLINPNIRLNGLIQLDQASIYRIELPEDAIRAAKNKIGSVETNGIITTEIPTTNSDSNAENRPASLATDGVYIVRSITITGDTRGQAWYMDMMCQARGSRGKVNDSILLKTGA